MEQALIILVPKIIEIKLSLKKKKKTRHLIFLKPCFYSFWWTLDLDQQIDYMKVNHTSLHMENLLGQPKTHEKEQKMNQNQKGLDLAKSYDI